jgi:hypothetical protein
MTKSFRNNLKLLRYYQNWEGTAQPSGWSVDSTYAITVNDGVTIDAINNNGFYYYSGAFGSPIILETFGQTNPNTGFVAACHALGSSPDSSNNGFDPTWRPYGSSTQWEYSIAGSWSSQSSVPLPPANTNYIASIQETPSSTNILVNGVSLVTSGTGMPSGYYYSYLADASASDMMYWLRTRAYPPNGSMPSVSFSAVQ